MTTATTALTWPPTRENAAAWQAACDNGGGAS